MPQKLVLDEDGYIDIEIPIAGGDVPASVRLDIDIAAERFTKASKDSGDDGMLWIETLAEAAKELGLPKLSHHNYARVARTVWNAARELEKKDGATLPQDDEQGSLGTTESTASN